MRGWILVVAVLAGSLGPAICHITCAMPPASEITAASEPSCHETERDTDGPALVALPCRHADRDSQDARATSIFQLPAVDRSPLVLDTSNGFAIDMFIAAAAASPSPPPLLIPLRI